MATITITSDLISDELIAEMTTYIKDELEREERRAVKMDDVASFFGDRLPDLKSHQIKLALSKSVAEKRLPGLAMKMGKAGGIGIDDGTVPAPRKPSKPRGEKKVKSVRAKKVTNEVTDIAIGTKQYALPMSAESVENLFVPVFDLEANDEGEIVIGTKKFTANSDNAAKYIENCIWYMLKNSANSFAESDDEDLIEDSDSENDSDESDSNEEIRKSA